MRIKNSALYDRLRERQILPLPCKDTLNSYIQKLDSAFGFPKAIFETLAYRTSRMETYSKRGTLLIDEVALSEGVKLNSRTMKFDGFVDLGDHTPQKYLNTRADHALVFMFQPFQGDWVQVVGSFLSKNSVTSDILHKLITECILLLEKAGLQVDCVTTDAAQWNRGAWKIFGIEDQKFSCEHPYDANRRLWFASDFCHLLKNFRNGIIKLPCFWTPDGIVKMLHWEVLLKLEAYGKMNMKIGFKLSPSHLKPEGFQKMNVLLATQLFSRQLRVAMSIYKNDNYELHDCEPTIAFMAKVDNLIKAMSSRTPENGLRQNADCPMKKVFKLILNKFLVIS
ncbi:uncharacterized protein LOC141532263 isoform X2 [Cotesia typhae]|uniref:uncharacterized protein LOC141532263 isoform X2 n=1 Tax=Cotesia typhae TaxID=2053667 RepID=UPI003D6984DE